MTIDNPSRPVATIRTEDGYTFYVLQDGRVVDGLDPDRVDMSWESFGKFEEEVEVAYSITDVMDDGGKPA